MNTKTPTSRRFAGAEAGASQSRSPTLIQIMEAQSSSTTPTRRPRARSSPSTSEGTPPGSDGDEAGRVASAYLRIFGRPPLGDHPELDGYAAGRTLAEQYPEDMQRVMSGIRRGVKEGTKAAEAAGGQRDE